MSSYDFRPLFSIPSQLETDIPATILLGQMWWYALTVLYPARALKSMGLYPNNEIGQYPSIVPLRGEGQFYCHHHHKPCYLDNPSQYDNSIEYFDRISAVYGTCMEPFTRPIYEEAVRLMEPLLTSDARILDTSCGPGTETLQLAALVPHGEVVGMDLAAGMVATAFEKARQQGVHNTAFFQADVARMPKHFEGRFDATFCFGAFHHYPDPLGAVREMHRVLNKSGIAFMVDPGPRWFNIISAPMAKWADPGWISFYTGEELQALFREAGFFHFYWNEVLPGFGMCIGTK